MDKRDKAEPKKILVWVKMINVPMEAWSVKEISALASSIGKPVIMDEITAMMCVTRVVWHGSCSLEWVVQFGTGPAVWHEPEQFSSELNNISLV
ncbi:RNA-directed DNA polymerase, eukaryota, reverse transcriptase zinc-binding domain protein [Tanacetum coccineum]